MHGSYKLIKVLWDLVFAFLTGSHSVVMQSTGATRVVITGATALAKGGILWPRLVAHRVNNGITEGTIDGFATTREARSTRELSVHAPLVID